MEVNPLERPTPAILSTRATREGSDGASDRPERSFGDEIESVVERRDRRNTTFGSADRAPARDTSRQDVAAPYGDAASVSLPVDAEPCALVANAETVVPPPPIEPPSRDVPRIDTTAGDVPFATSETPRAVQVPVTPSDQVAPPQGAVSAAPTTSGARTAGVPLASGTRESAPGGRATPTASRAMERRAPEAFETKMQELARRMRVQLHARGQDVRLRLDPEELGEVQVRFTLREGRMHAFLFAEDGRAAQWLFEGGEALRRSLAEVGIRLEQLQVHDEGSANASHDGHRGAAHAESGDRSSARVLERHWDATAGTSPWHDTTRWHDGHVSLWA